MYGSTWTMKDAHPSYGTKEQILPHSLAAPLGTLICVGKVLRGNVEDCQWCKFRVTAPAADLEDIRILPTIQLTSKSAEKLAVQLDVCDIGPATVQRYQRVDRLYPTYCSVPHRSARIRAT